MSDYTKLTNFAVKDGYTTGNPAKVIKGTEIDDEFNAISTAVSTKYDSSDIIPIANGGTGTTTASAARAALSAAQSGANSDITSLSGLTTALSVAQGGTGAATLTANNVLLGNGTSALQTVAPGAAGNILTSNGSAWISQALPIKILSITQGYDTASYTNGNSSATDVITVSVTPQSASSKFIIIANVTLVCSPGSNNGALVYLVRNSTIVFSIRGGHGLNNTFVAGLSPVAYDAPATTSSITYKLQAIGFDSSTIQTGGYPYNIIVVEYQ